MKWAPVVHFSTGLFSSLQAVHWYIFSPPFTGDSLAAVSDQEEAVKSYTNALVIKPGYDLALAGLAAIQKNQGISEVGPIIG